jgi:hypothetical protein
MKLIRQVRLVLPGAVAKVHEVDLCEVGADQYVVNYRYGKLGKALQDGSLTALPVRRDEAQRLFDGEIAKREAKGYRDVNAPAVPAAPPAPPTAPFVSSASPQAAAATSPKAASQRTSPRAPLDQRARLLFRLRAGDDKYKTWPLDRAVWRAGELGLSEAEPELIRLLQARMSDNLRKYLVVWALSRCGSRAAIDPLVKLYEDPSAPTFLKRVSAEALRALLTDPEREGLVKREREKLPPKLAQLAETGPARAFEKALWELFETDKQSATEVYWTAYFIANEHTLPAVLRVCREAPLERPYFKLLRALFKTAELRRDGQVYGVLAHRFERAKAKHNFHGQQSATQARPFSERTRNYYRWRTWRTLRRLGDQGSPDFAKMATGVLLPYTDEDARRIGRFWSFCSLLYRHSPQHVADARQRYFSVGPAPVVKRSEAYSTLWDAAPLALMHLLDASRCEQVHEFAVRVLRENLGFLAQLDIEAIVMLLDRGYAATAALGFDLAKQRHDSNNPNPELLLALAQCAYPPARAESYRYIEQARQRLSGDSSFLCQLCMSVHVDTRSFAKDFIRRSTLGGDTASALVGRLVAGLLELGEAPDPRVDEISEILLRGLTMQIGDLGVDVLRDLIRHPMPRVQELGGDLLLANRNLSRELPSDLLMALLGGKEAAVRATGMRLLGQLSDGELSRRPELLLALASGEHADLREAVRPLVERGVRARPEFAAELGELLLERLRFAADPQLHGFVADLLRKQLTGFLQALSPSEVLRLLRSRFAHAQELGGELLRTNVPPDAIDIADLVKLVDHEIRAVRESCWALCEKNIERLQRAADRAVRLLETKWEDSRAWAFQFFHQHFDDSVLGPALLVSICDSIRPEVQQFGRELITRYFDPKYGPEYLLKLSEHPSEALQLFATNYLDSFAAGKPEQLNQLLPYFTAILSRVNKGRLAKIRALAFLEKEALASAEAAAIVAPLLARQVLTLSIENKAALIETMVRVHEKYPEIPLPVAVSAPQPREAARGI